MTNKDKEVVNIKVKVDDSEIKEVIKLLQELEEIYKRVQTLRKELYEMGDIEVKISSET